LKSLKLFSIVSILLETNLVLPGDEGVNMSLSISPAVSASVMVQTNQTSLQGESVTRAAVMPVEKAPAVAAEPLVDPQEMRANLEAAIETLNQQVQRNGRGLQFAIDEKLNRPIITVRNTSNGEIVRTIPSEVVLKVAHHIEAFKGILADHLL
jgi:flagellar protein FlaG